MSYKVKDYSLLHILEALDESGLDIKADGTYTDAEGNTHALTIFDKNYFYQNILVNHRSRKCTLWGDDEAAAFYSLFLSWWGSRKDLYLKQAYAYTLKYNPIENYSSREVMTNDITTHLKGTTDTRTHGDTVTTTYADTMTRTHNDTMTSRPAETTETTIHPTRTETTTPYGDTVTTNPGKINTHSKKAFNSAAFEDVEKDTESGQESVVTTHQGTEQRQEVYTGTDTVAQTTQTAGTDAHTGTIADGHTGTQSNAHTGTIADAHTGTDTDTRNYTLTKSGNIGVQTAAEMLQREYDGLVQDLSHRAFSEFIDRYTFYRDSWDGEVI